MAEIDGTIKKEFEEISLRNERKSLLDEITGKEEKKKDYSNEITKYEDMFKTLDADIAEYKKAVAKKIKDYTKYIKKRSKVYRKNGNESAVVDLVNECKQKLLEDLGLDTTAKQRDYMMLRGYVHSINDFESFDLYKIFEYGKHKDDLVKRLDVSEPETALILDYVKKSEELRQRMDRKVNEGDGMIKGVGYPSGGLLGLLIGIAGGGIGVLIGLGVGVGVAAGAHYGWKYLKKRDFNTEQGFVIEDTIKRLIETTKT